MFRLPFGKKKPAEVKLPKTFLPKVRTKTLPGPQSQKLAEPLKRYECPQITYQGGIFPVFFKGGAGANLYDVDGNRYLDLTSAFGVCGVGHSNPAVIAAARRQMADLVHGLGDVHPSEGKILLAKRLAEITPGNLSQTIFSTTGGEAVETALKTAVMHTKKPGVIAFTGAYHGLGYGALEVTHREDFRAPFRKQMGGFSHRAPFPDARLYGSEASKVAMKAVESLFKKAKRSKFPVGAVILEPIQGRGGVISAPVEFLKALRVFCDENKVLLIADEVFTGFGRTGSMFAMEKSGVVPDLLCVGKGISDGFPLSACVGSSRVMFSWGASTGDAIHTSTFLGHPLACAAALATIREIEEKKFVERSRQMGELFRKELWKLKEKYAVIGDVRGSGLMIGIELVETHWGLLPVSRSKKKTPAPPPPASGKARLFVEEAMKAGLVMLGCGPDHNILQATPPFVIGEREIAFCAKTFDAILKKIS